MTDRNDTQSVWAHSVNRIKKPRAPLAGDIKTDVLVIGGGMAGVLIAHRLSEAGVDCMLAEAKTIGSGTTGNTTAKITAQHGLIYADLIRRFGIEKARMHYEANTRAISDFCALAGRYDCDLEKKTAYIYSIGNRKKLEREADAYRALGLPGRIRDRLPLPLQTDGALAMDNQAQFNPLKLLCGVADKLRIFENTFVSKIEGNIALAGCAKITAKHIVFATHYPLVNIPGLYFMKLYQHRSYVLALEGAPDVEGMYLDEREDGCSFRNYGGLLFIGGGDHKTGKRGGGYTELKKLAAKAYPNAAEKYRWAAQDTMSLDAIPYIGRHRAGKGNLYVATGFNKWGMTGAMVASRLICDLIVYGCSELEDLYSPRRSMLRGQLFLNFGAAAAGLLNPGVPRCPHMGCKLRWNDAERTWDCSCHGSRFDESGRLLDNPAKEDIQI